MFQLELNSYEEMVVGILLSSFLGLIYGSFATALIYRIPKSISWVYDKSKSKASRSSCTKCGYQLIWIDLIPILSWIFLNGKCRKCHSKIGVTYFLTETASLAICLAIFLLWGISVISLLLMLSVPFILSLIVIDLKYKILPNQLVLILFVFGFIYHFINYNNGIIDISAFFSEYLLGAFAYGFTIYILGATMSFFLKRNSLGFGDVKFFIVAGLWLGISFFPYFLVFSGVLGVVFGLLWRFLTKEDVFPFGPALIVAFTIGVCIKQNVVDNYIMALIN